MKIKLLILNDKVLDLSQRFYECKSLQKFSVISPKEIKLENEIHYEEENNQINIPSVHDSEGTNNQSSNQFYGCIDSNKKSQTISSIQNTIIASKCRNIFNIINFSNIWDIFITEVVFKTDIPEMDINDEHP